MCGSCNFTGCASCSHLCHESNADVRCPYFQRMRSDLSWHASEKELMDTQAGTGGAVPHFSQVRWRFEKERTPRGSRRVVVVDDARYTVGYGDPGRAADGEFNNCLIDSLRQCVGIISDRKAVRHALIEEFGSADGRAKVTGTSYLDIDSHWRSILRGLFEHNLSGLPHHCSLGSYCVIALDATNTDNGVVLGNLDAPIRLVVLNHSDVHFDPCLPMRAASSSSGSVFSA